MDDELFSNAQSDKINVGKADSTLFYHFPSPWKNRKEDSVAERNVQRIAPAIVYQVFPYLSMENGIGLANIKVTTNGEHRLVQN